jgi:hypothetical protein
LPDVSIFKRGWRRARKYRCILRGAVPAALTRRDLWLVQPQIAKLDQQLPNGDDPENAFHFNWVATPLIS